MTSNLALSETALAAVKKVETRNWLTQLLAGALVGLCVGAALGGVLFSAMAADATATALVRIVEPPDLVAIAGGASQTTPQTQDNTGRYVAGEVAYLSGDGFGQAVAAKLGKSKPPKLKVVQDGQSSVVTISNTAPSRDDAIRAVQMTIDLYGQQLAERTDRQLQVILPALGQWQQTADGPGGAAIQALRDRIRLQAAQSSKLTVLQPPMTDYVSSHRATIGAVLGGFLGGALVPLILMARRKRSGRLSISSGASVITDAVDRTLIPVIDLRQPPRPAWSDEQVILGRKLYAQLGAPEVRRTIVLIGASPGSGTSTVAALLELAAAEHGPVHVTNEPITRPDPDTTVIVKAGTIGDTGSIPEAIASATDLVVVCRVGYDTVEQIHIVRSACASSAAPLNAAFTSMPWWKFTRNSDQKSRPHVDNEHMSASGSEDSTRDVIV